jgi:Pvc16 N-terminal domain
MSADAIFRVTEALRARLQQALADAMDPGTVFVGPLDDLDAKGAPLILFLYRVIANASLRNREHRVPSDRPPPPVLVFNNSLPLDLYYLVTVGTLPLSSEETRLKTLGFAMRALNQMPDLVGASVGHESVHVSLEPLTTEEISRIWTLFPTANYRTSIAYLATPVWIDPPQPVPSASRVLQDNLRVGQKAREVPNHV